MDVIVLATRKGGSGKSTLAIGLALAAQRTGQLVRLIETDSQGTLSNWQSRRGIAEPLVEHFCDTLRALGVPVQTGIFGAYMEVSLVNDGPVTIILDVEQKPTGRSP